MVDRKPNTDRDPFLHLLDPVIYGDLFDFPITQAEMRRFCHQEFSQEGLADAVRKNRDFNRLVARQEEFYFLRGREDLVALRKSRTLESAKGWQKAHGVIRFIKYVPFIQGILVTGSLAVDNARKKDDLDFLIMTAPRRLWLVFFILGVLQRIFSRRFLCPNYYMSTDHLRLPRESLYTARETIQARPIFGEATCRRFREQNSWVDDYFPNAANGAVSKDVIQARKGPARWFTGCCEWLLNGWLGDRLENLLQRFLKHRLFAHYGTHGQEVPPEVMQNALDEVELRFHGLGHEESIYKEIDRRRDKLLSQLDNGSSQ